MKTTDKMRAIGITMWVLGGILSLGTVPLVASLTIGSGLLFGVSLILDTIDSNPDGVWNREGLYYVARAQWDAGHNRVTRERKLDFFSYNLIRFIHGDEKLITMAMKLDVE